MIFRCLRMFPGWRLHFVQLRDHEVVEGVCVPCSHESGEDPPENAHETTKLSEKVEEVIPGARVVESIQVHLDRESHPLVWLLLQGINCSLFQMEQFVIWMIRPFVKIRVPSILLGSMSRLDLVAMHIFIRAANG